MALKTSNVETEFGVKLAIWCFGPKRPFLFGVDLPNVICGTLGVLSKTPKPWFCIWCWHTKCVSHLAHLHEMWCTLLVCTPNVSSHIWRAHEMDRNTFGNFTKWIVTHLVIPRNARCFFGVCTKWIVMRLEFWHDSVWGTTNNAMIKRVVCNVGVEHAMGH